MLGYRIVHIMLGLSSQPHSMNVLLVTRPKWYSHVNKYMVY